MLIPLSDVEFEQLRFAYELNLLKGIPFRIAEPPVFCDSDVISYNSGLMVSTQTCGELVDALATDDDRFYETQQYLWGFWRKGLVEGELS